MPKKNILFNILISLFAIVITIFFIECSLSLFSHDEYALATYINTLNLSDPSHQNIFIFNQSSSRKYYHRPNSSTEEYIYINSFGIRDREYRKEKASSTSRIIFLGDSVVFGSTVRINSTFVELLEVDLNAQKGRNYEVWNAGVSGYNTLLEEAFLKDNLINYDPDLVVLGFVLNDFSSRMITVSNSNNGSAIFVYENLNTYPLLNHRFIDLSLYLIRHSYFFRFINIKLSSIIKHESSNKQVALNSIYSMDRLMKSKGKKFMVLIIPAITNYSDYGYLEEHHWLKKNLEELNITYLDLYDGLKEYDYKKFSVNNEDIWHYNNYGNRIIADILFNYFNDSAI
jgi:hypothetical protein